jgi:hypothetical protein
MQLMQRNGGVEYKQNVAPIASPEKYISRGKHCIRRFQRLKWKKISPNRAISCLISSQHADGGTTSKNIPGSEVGGGISGRMGFFLLVCLAGFTEKHESFKNLKCRTSL